MAMWTLEDALKVVRALQPPSKEYGFHVTLGGSVLNKGESEKDLDLYFHPLKDETPKADGPVKLLEWLEGMWGEGNPIVQSGDPYGEGNKWGLDLNFLNNLDDPPVFKKVKVPPTPSKGETYTYKLKFIRSGGDRIDVFIL